MNKSGALLAILLLGVVGNRSAQAQAPSDTVIEAAGEAPSGTPSQAASREYALAIHLVPAGSRCARNEKLPLSDPKCKRPKSGRIELGAGYQPDEKFMFKASAVQDRLFGSAHALRLDAIISQRRQDFAVQYRVPRLFGSNRELEMEMHNTRLAYRDLALSRVGGSVQMSRPLGGGIGVYSGYRLEQISSESLAPQTAALGAHTGPSEGLARETGIVAAWRSGVTYNNGALRSRRKQADIFTEVSAPWLGSDYELVRAGAKASLRQPLIGPFGLHLQGGLEGVMSKPGSLVPRAERLYFEGHSDVRGFPLGSAGDNRGGNFKATGRAELEFKIIPSWGVSGALFYDAGVFGTGASAEIAQSVGGSLIFETPIGPLRLDLACPLDDAASPSLLVGVGSNF